MMKLHYSPASQYVRKVMVVAIELGLDGQIELITDRDQLKRHNPLLKRPALVTDEGDAIINSPVICAYLNSLASGDIIPAAGRDRWKALSLEALADGIMEAATAVRHDGAFHPGAGSQAWRDRQMLKIIQGFDALQDEAARGAFTKPLTIAHVTAGVLCGYMDFLFTGYDWRSSRPALSAFYADLSERQSMKMTIPRDFVGRR